MCPTHSGRSSACSSTAAKSARVVDGKGPGRSLTRADFAAVLLEALDRPEWVGHMVGVANR